MVRMMFLDDACSIHVQATLVFCLKRGVNMASKDFGGGSDPYAVVQLLSKCRSVLCEAKTRVFKKNLNACFNLEVEGNISPTEPTFIRVEIWDKDTLSSDDWMGEVEYSINPLAYFNQQGIELALIPGSQHPRVCVHPTYIAYIHTYIHTYIQTYIHTHTYRHNLI